MNIYIIISAFSYLLHFLSLHKSLVYPPFVYILYNEYSEDVTGEFSPAKYQWCNWGGTLGAIAPASIEKSPFLKRIQNWNLPFSSTYGLLYKNFTTRPFRRVAKNNS